MDALSQTGVILSLAKQPCTDLYPSSLDLVVIVLRDALDVLSVHEPKVPLYRMHKDV